MPAEEDEVVKPISNVESFYDVEGKEEGLRVKAQKLILHEVINFGNKIDFNASNDTISANTTDQASVVPEASSIIDIYNDVSRNPSFCILLYELLHLDPRRSIVMRVNMLCPFINYFSTVRISGIEPSSPRLKSSLMYSRYNSCYCVRNLRTINHY